MRFLAVLNRDGGMLRTADLEGLAAGMRATLEAAGHQVVIHTISGREVVAALSAAATADADAVIVGGGDGTASAAACRLMDTGKALAILPAGTMNLFARSLGMPLELQDAIHAIADGEIRHVDMAVANGRPFVHQFSIGLHARVIKLRSRLEFRSRLGKLWASARAAYDAMANPPMFQVSLSMGDTEIFATTTGIGVSNNPFDEGHLPYPDFPDRGTLGIYISSTAGRAQLLWLFLKIALGRHWQDSEFVQIHESESVTLRVEPDRHRQLCSIDGELCELDAKITIKSRPLALRVLAPKRG